MVADAGAASSGPRGRSRTAPSTEPPVTASASLHGVSGDAVERVPMELDRLIHERLRLGIVSALAVNDVLSFSDLKKLLHSTDGNLSVHARRLEDAGYVSCRKGFDGRVPRTEYRLTRSGRQALERYLNHMEALINATREHV